MTLIKSTLSRLGIYFMSAFTIPVSMVASRLEKLQRDLLWGGFGEEFKYDFMDWDKSSTPVQEGGLGVRRLAIFNQSLLGKRALGMSQVGVSGPH